MSSSSRVLPTPLENKYMKPPDSCHLSPASDLAANSVSSNSVRSAANPDGTLFSYASQHDKQYEDPPLFLRHWDIIGFPENISAQHDQVVENGCYINDDNVKRTDFGEWVDQLMSIDDSLHPNWSQLLGDDNVAEPKPKVPQLLDIPSGEVVGNSAATTPQTKTRMRWTPELHEAFVEAVNQLGGSERTSEKKATPIEEMKSLDLKTSKGITEALRLQMELQKRLHEQLEIQRKLQIQIEDQGKRLQMMFEKQREMGDKKVNGSSDEAATATPAAPSDSVLPSSPPVETSNEGREKSMEEEKEESTKQKAREGEEVINEDEDEVAPATKRVKSS
ncbi:hypothetical protein ACSQ67_012243 [Phaseolus vulgaris]